MIMMMFWLVFYQISCQNFVSKDAPECYNSTQCVDNATCIEGTCYEVSCRDNQDCALRETCQEGECVSGCDSETDCLAGELCADGFCAEGTDCRTAQLDCGYGEDCTDGLCLEAAFPFCQPCAFADWQQSPNGAQECIIYTYTLEESCQWGQTECSGDLSCYPADQIGDVEEGFCIASYVFRPCALDSDCPRPFTCKEDVYGTDSGVNVCWADCPFWREQRVF